MGQEPQPRAKKCPFRGLRSGLGRDQAAPDRVAGQLDPVPHPELLEHVLTVPVDRLPADEELLTDLLARQALGDQLHNLELARAERVLRRGLAPAGPLQVVAHERAHGGRVEERLPAHGGPARLDQVPVGHALQDVARGARLERLEEVLLVVVHRQDQYLELGLLLRELARSLKARHVIRGIVTSSTARSTSVERASATASAPSLACATTSRSGAESSTSRRPSRTTSWSSASRIRVFSGTVIGRLGPAGS